MLCMPLSSAEHVDELHPLVLFSALQQTCAGEVYVGSARKSRHLSLAP